MLWEFRVLDGDALTLVCLPVPEESDDIGVCDGCGDWRHTTRQGLLGSVWLCHFCGGRQTTVSDINHDTGDEDL